MGTAWGGCSGEMLPAEEQCDGVDHDCDGATQPADLDGDGWNVCDGDCCELDSECDSPALVNPGAFELSGNDVDDDCDAGTEEGVAPTECSLEADFSNVTAAQLAAAMGLCSTVTQASGRAGLISAELVNPDGSDPSGGALSDMMGSQTAVMTAYGVGGVAPTDGMTLAGLSNGTMRGAGDPGYAAPNPGTDHGRDDAAPAVYLAGNGGELPSSAGCSGTCVPGTGANDGVSLRLTLRVPTNARSFAFSHRFFSADYAMFACQLWNDHFLALLTSGASGIPNDTNIVFDAMGNPMTVNSAFIEQCSAQGCYSCPGGSSSLSGTGMDASDTGAATPWLETTAPVVPGEVIVLELMIFDVSDNIVDSHVLLDAFRWSDQPASVGTAALP
jgi:hypothetical protein